MSSPVKTNHQAKPGSLRWPMLVVLLLVSHVTLMAWAVTRITQDRNGGVIPNYYQKSLKWDEDRRARLNETVKISAATQPSAEASR